MDLQTILQTSLAPLFFGWTNVPFVLLTIRDRPQIRRQMSLGTYLYYEKSGLIWAAGPVLWKKNWGQSWATFEAHLLKFSWATDNFFFENKLCFETKMTKVYSRNLLMKWSKDNFIFLLVFHLIMCLMKAPKNFGKIAILKRWELVSLGDAKTHFGKIALLQCIFRHEKKNIFN